MAPTDNKTCSESSESDTEMALDNRNTTNSKITRGKLNYFSLDLDEINIARSKVSWFNI